MAVEGVPPEAVGLGGFELMFYTLPQVFASLGVAGGIIGGFFFLMVAIAAITSVVSLLEVVTQFIIQAFHVNRKIASIFPMVAAAAISVLVSLSLGGRFQVFGFDLLTYFDEVTNTVLMPVGALAACVCVGWAVPRREFEQHLVPGKPMIGRVISYMARFVSPVLIVAVEISGTAQKVADNVWYWAVVAGAVALILVCVAVYAIFFYRRQTGCNADEMLAESKRK